jgi:hypothetical protein
MSNVIDFDSRIPARRKVAEVLIKVVRERTTEDAIKAIVQALEECERAGLAASSERAALLAETFAKHLRELAEKDENR